MLEFSPLQLTRETRLRLFQMADVNEYFQLIDKNRSGLKTWLGWLNSHNSLQDTIDFIKDPARLYGAGTQASPDPVRAR